MWSRIAEKKEEIILDENELVKEPEIKVIEVPTKFDLEFNREIKGFVKENYDILNYLYNKCFKEYGHISKTDFYIFAYYNSRK